MRAVIVAVVVGLALIASVAAGPRKVLVLPLDGSASAQQRTSINAAVVLLAKAGIDGDVTAGDATFNETAAAVGCSPDQPACAGQVLTTLSVDELIYGTATTENGSTTITIHRIAKGTAPRDQVAVIDASATGDQASSSLQPLFTREPSAEGSAMGSDMGSAFGSGMGSGSDMRVHTKSFFDTRERKIGFGFAAGSVATLIIGFSLWASESSVQDQIDNHPTTTLADLQDLRALEDRAGTKALWGNICVAVGVGLGAVSTYYFWQDHKNRNVVVAPAPTEGGTGAAIVLGGRW